MIALPRASIATPPTPHVLGGRSRAVGVWLFVVAAFVYVMVVVGGATRLTGSGLSITEWKPIAGALPPLSDSAWLDAFGKYQASSQYRLINQGIDLAHFKILFWWEWGHRLLGRTVGMVFAVPFVLLLVSRRIPGRLVGRCWALLALGGLQGLAGWWMVKSGLEGRAAVAPERLTIHLGLALALLAALVWTGAEAWSGEGRGSRENQGRGMAWPFATMLLAVGVYCQCLLGALVAGNGGGLVDIDWPLMGGRVVPDDYWRGDLVGTLTHSPPAVQFNHRLLAYGLLTLAVALLAKAWRSTPRPRGVLNLTMVVLGLLGLQATLGVATLMTGDGLALALAHQANAAVLLTAAVLLAWRTRRVSR
jgi:cytochrome c oxidase assembly protein subunit 15